MTENELVQQLKDEKQRHRAFKILVDQYSQKLYWQIRKMLLNHDDSNDVLQNTFIKIWNGVADFRGESKLSTWMYRIAINETFTFLNQQRQRHQMDMVDMDSILGQHLKSDSYFDGDELQKKLQAAILTLPDKQRLVFNMKYYDELKYEEMSEILGTSVGALKASYHIASKKIEQYILNSEL
jgi:RNA polymerase sigma-70 factor (ECF subfamily)